VALYKCIIFIIIYFLLLKIFLLFFIYFILFYSLTITINIFTLGKYNPERVQKLKEKSGYDLQSMLSTAGKLSCRRTALKRRAPILRSFGTGSLSL